MKLVLTMMMMNLLILFVIFILLNMLSKKSFYDKEKNSPFECGFEPKSSSRMSFSIQFFLIAMIFLIFDIEVVLILPVIKIMKISNFLSMMTTLNMFLLILLMGFFHELNQGALKWLK